MDREKNTDGTSAAPETTDGKMPGRIFSGDAARTGGNAAGEEFEELLAPAVIPNDGRQTPMRGHPVFIAQHATACCCRKCLEKWHRIPAGRELSAAEQRYVVAVLMAWIGRQPLRQAGTNRPVR